MEPVRLLILRFNEADLHRISAVPRTTSASSTFDGHFESKIPLASTRIHTHWNRVYSPHMYVVWREEVIEDDSVRMPYSDKLMSHSTCTHQNNMAIIIEHRAVRPA